MPIFDTDHYTVRQLFSEDFVFEFPFYQRPYRWTTEHAATLLDDILSACASPQTLDELPPYFMGSIVLVRKDEDDRHVQVIDGRQRLTTIAILLAVLRDLETHARTKTDLHEMLFDDRSELMEIEPGPRMRTKGLENDYLGKWVIPTGATLAELPEEDIPDRAARIFAVVQLFRRRLSNLAEQDRSRLRDFTVKHCEIVAVITQDEEQGLRIFQVLNTRGLPLSEVDLIKTDLLTSLAPELQETAVDIWDNAENSLGADGMTKLLRVLYSVFARDIAPDDSKLFHQRFVTVAKQRDLNKLCTEELAEYAELLYQINNGEIPATNLAANSNDIIHALNWLGWDSQDWLPVAVELIIRSKEDDALAYRWLQALERVCYSFFVLRGSERAGRDARREVFGKTLNDLALDRDPARLDGPLTLNADTRRRLKEALSAPIEFSYQRRALLQRVELALSQNRPHPKLDVASPEHVLPYNKPRNSDWAQFDRKAHLDHRNLLGNLTLLDAVTNVKGANQSYLNKKRLIFRRPRRFFETTKDLRQHDDWTPEIIRVRTARFVDILSTAWALN